MGGCRREERASDTAGALELEGAVTVFHGWKVGDMVFVGGQRFLWDLWRDPGIEDIEIQTDHTSEISTPCCVKAGGDRHTLMRQNTYFRFFGQGREVTDYWGKMTNVSTPLYSRFRQRRELVCGSPAFRMRTS